MTPVSNVVQAPSRPALEVVGLTKQFRRGAKALDGVTLSLPAGSMTAFLGPNGAGKSTLLRTWLRFERPTAGAVQIQGVDPWKDAGVLSALAYVPQATNPYSGLDVDDHLRVAGSLRRGFDLAGARDRLRSLDIRLGQRASSLSGGQRAQLFLTMALATNAQILLLDEPLASLDPLARLEFLVSLGDARRRDGLTVVLSSHVVADLAAVFDRVLLLANGRLVLDDTVANCIGRHWVSDAQLDVSIAKLPNLGGAPLFLNAEPRLGRGAPATMDHVVLGYLALARGAERR